MSRRTDRLASVLRDAVQDVITRGIQDPRVSGLVTVTSVRVSQDARAATVMISVFPAERQDLTLHGLRAAAGHIRHEVGALVDTRRVPELSFKADESLKKQAAVIRDVLRATAEREASPAPDAGEGPA